MKLITKSARCEHCAADLESTPRLAESTRAETWNHVNRDDRHTGGLHAAFPVADTICEIR